MIYLRPRRAQLPQLAFDDVADVIATGVNDQPGRWGPRDVRRVALGAGAVALAAGAVFILRSGPPWTDPAVAAAAIGAALAHRGRGGVQGRGRPGPARCSATPRSPTPSWPGCSSRPAH